MPAKIWKLQEAKARFSELVRRHAEESRSASPFMEKTPVMVVDPDALRGDAEPNG